MINDSGTCLSRCRSWVATTTVVPSGSLSLSASRRDHHGGARAIECFKQAQQLDRHFRIEVAGRLVGNQQVGAADHRPGNRDALLLSARQLGRKCVLAFAQLDPVEHVSHGVGQFALGNPGHTQRQGHVVVSREMGNQAEVLEDDTQPPAQGWQPFARQGNRIGPEHADHSARGALGQIEQLEQRGLASTAGASQEIEAAREEREGNVAQHLVFRAIAQPDIIELNNFPVGDVGHGSGAIR